MTRPKGKGGRTRRHPSSVRLLLLTGIPGTGKTTTGDHLRDTYGFRHLDFEHLPTLDKYLGGAKGSLLREIGELRKTGRDAVISWGFVPDVQLPYVLLLRKLGFRWIWFDGDRESALREYLGCGRSQRAWGIQLEKIESVIDPQLETLQPKIVNTFAVDGAFRRIADIVTDLLG